MEKKHNYRIGVFRKGELVYQCGNTVCCTAKEATLLVFLFLSKMVLTGDDYIAYDYA